MTSFGSVLFAVGGSSWAFASGRGICAVGAVSCFLALLSFCASSAKGRSGSFLGKALMIGNIGGVLAGAPLALLLEHTSLNNTWLILAAACAALVSRFNQLRCTTQSLFARAIERGQRGVGAGRVGEYFTIAVEQTLGSYGIV
jgi:hypothetical protein